MRQVGSGRDGARLRALMVILWRAGLRIGEALDLAETDVDASRGAVLVRRGKGGRRREVGMDRWAWSQQLAHQGIDSSEIINTVHSRFSERPRNEAPVGLKPGLTGNPPVA